MVVTPVRELIKRRGRRRKTSRAGYVFNTNGSWFVRYYTGKMVPHTKRDGTEAMIREQVTYKLGSKQDIRTKDDANRKADEYLRSKLTKRGAIHSNVTIGKYYEDVMVPLWKLNLKPSTRYGYEQIWRLYLKPTMDEVHIAEYTIVDASNYLDGLAVHGLNANTISHIRNVAYAIFSQAVTKGVIQANPFNGAKMTVKAKRPKDYVPFTPQQVKDVLMGLSGCLQAQVAVGLCYFCSLRPGEARAARWENYDGAHLMIVQSAWKKVVGTTKTKQSAQAVNVPGPMQELLARYREAEGRPMTGWILHNESGGLINFDFLAREIIKPILKVKGIPWHPIKYFRNDAASHVADATGDSLASAAMLRHKTPATTDNYYSKIMEAAGERASSTLEGLVPWELAGTKQLTAASGQ